MIQRFGHSMFRRFSETKARARRAGKRHQRQAGEKEKFRQLLEYDPYEFDPEFDYYYSDCYPDDNYYPDEDRYLEEDYPLEDSYFEEDYYPDENYPLEDYYSEDQNFITSTMLLNLKFWHDLVAYARERKQLESLKDLEKALEALLKSLD